MVVTFSSYKTNQNKSSLSYHCVLSNNVGVHLGRLQSREARRRATLLGTHDTFLGMMGNLTHAISQKGVR
jgi:hypothetical protein